MITCLVSFAVSLLGFNALHLWERYTWIPNLVSIVIAVGCGGNYLHLQSEAAPATPSQILTYGSLIAGYFITFGGTVSDYSIYHNPRVSKYARAAPLVTGGTKADLEPGSGFSCTCTQASCSLRFPS